MIKQKNPPTFSLMNHLYPNDRNKQEEMYLRKVEEFAEFYVSNKLHAFECTTISDQSIIIVPHLFWCTKDAPSHSVKLDYVNQSKARCSTTAKITPLGINETEVEITALVRANAVETQYLEYPKRMWIRHAHLMILGNIEQAMCDYTIADNYRFIHNLWTFEVDKSRDVWLFRWKYNLKHKIYELRDILIN